MKIILIAAMARNRVIGKDNGIPWHIPGEQKRFQGITMGHALVMGRKTHESIGRPLPGRKNVVITRQRRYRAPGCLVVHSLQEALAACREEQKIFIIGGAQIYQEALPLADMISLTILRRAVDGDTFFPEFSEAEFRKTFSEAMAGEEPYTLTLFERTPGGKNR